MSQGILYDLSAGFAFGADGQPIDLKFGEVDDPKDLMEASRSNNKVRIGDLLYSTSDFRLCSRYLLFRITPMGAVTQ